MPASRLTGTSAAAVVRRIGRRDLRRKELVGGILANTQQGAARGGLNRRTYEADAATLARDQPILGGRAVSNKASLNSRRFWKRGRTRSYSGSATMKDAGGDRGSVGPSNDSGGGRSGRFMYHKYAPSAPELHDLVHGIAVARGRRRVGEMLPKDVVTGFVAQYAKLRPAERQALLLELARDLRPSPEIVESAWQRYQVKLGKGRGGGPTIALEALREELTPLYETLFKAIAADSPAGIKFVLQLRTDVLFAIRELRRRSKESGSTMSSGGAGAEDAKASLLSNLQGDLSALDASLRTMLQDWFGCGFLQLQRITYEDSAGAVLEKIALYESVHKVRGLSDLKARLGRGRRCYAFFHHSLPGEPLVFVHVALLPRMASSMDYIRQHSGGNKAKRDDKKERQEKIMQKEHRIDDDDASGEEEEEGENGSGGVDEEKKVGEEDGYGDESDEGSFDDAANAAGGEEEEEGGEQSARCAVFYSINSTQDGLRGVQLGNFLIKSVVKLLRSDFEMVDSFSTLSPIPGFRSWLSLRVAKDLRRLNSSSSDMSSSSSSSSSSSGSSTGDDIAETTPSAPRWITEPLLLPKEETALLSVSKSLAPTVSPTAASAAAATESLKLLLDFMATNIPTAEQAAIAKPILLRLAATYLTREKRHGRLVDPVANFHLSNGAGVERINWAADTSMKGRGQSFGMMVNFKYRAEGGAIESNSHAYVTRGEVSASDAVQQLAATD